MLQLADADKTNINDLQSLKILIPRREMVPVGNLAQIVKMLKYKSVKPKESETDNICNW